MEILIILFVILCVVLFSYYSHHHYNKNKIKYIPNTNIVVKDSLIELINEYRTEQNLSVLLPEKTLMDASKERAIFLKSKDTLSHDGLTNLSEKIGANYFGEIMGRKYNTTLGLFKGYKNSPGHNEIILKDFKYVGSSTQDSYNCVLFAK